MESAGKRRDDERGHRCQKRAEKGGAHHEKTKEKGGFFRFFARFAVSLHRKGGRACRRPDKGGGHAGAQIKGAGMLAPR